MNIKKLKEKYINSSSKTRRLIVQSFKIMRSEYSLCFYLGSGSNPVSWVKIVTLEITAEIERESECECSKKCTLNCIKKV